MVTTDFVFSIAFTESFDLMSLAPSESDMVGILTHKTRQ